MKKLIDTKLVGKLMRETAKECGMTRLYSASDNCYWEADRLKRLFPKTHWSDYRRVTRRYDVVTDSFIESFDAKVKAEGFTISDCNPKLNMALGIGRERVDNIDVYNDPGYIEQWENAKKLYDKYASIYIERRPHLNRFDSDYFKLEPEHMHYFMGTATDFDYKSKECAEIYKAQDELGDIWRTIEPKVSYRYEYVVEKTKYTSTTLGDMYLRLTARMKS
tara:strand:- start:53 stop:712 length:660 start_codon:yes stop_codon:yes gene_type:complete